MKLISTTNPDAIAQAVNILKAGGTVAFPTDTVYGLGVLVNDSAGIEKLYAIKGRDKMKAIAVLLANPQALDQITDKPGDYAMKLADAFWPGPLTLVVPRRHDLPENLSPWDTVGVRIPDHEVALALLQATGPMAVTSANQSNASSARTAAEVVAQLGEQVDLVLDGGETPGGIASTVVDATGNQIGMIRQGPIGEAALMRVIAGNLFN